MIFIKQFSRALVLSLIFLSVSACVKTVRAQTVPAEGRKYSAGTQFTGPCKEMPPYPENPAHGTRYQGESISTEFYADFDKSGLVDSDGDGLVDNQPIGQVKPLYLSSGKEKCGTIVSGHPGKIVLTEPGQYWMVQYLTKVDNVHAELNLMEKEEKSVTETKRVKFYIEPEKPCAGTQNRIAEIFVEDKNGKVVPMSQEDRAELGLTNEQVNENQRLFVPSDFHSKSVMLEYDQSSGPFRMKVERGSSVGIGCLQEASTIMTREGRLLKLKFQIGKIWSYVTRSLNPNPRFEVHTERAVAGVRGTIFSISYDPEKDLTTLYVQEGTVDFANINNPALKIVVKAKQTAVVQGDNAPKFLP